MFAVRHGLLAAMLAALTTGCTTAPTLPGVMIVGDSTASAYGPERYPRMGWGMVLACGLDPRIHVDNRAASGRSTKSFVSEGRWAEALEHIRAGDIVLIQFGHNDEKSEDPNRYTASRGAFAHNLFTFVSDVRAHRGIPVLVTPVARRQFANSIAVDTHGDYDDAVRAVSSKAHVPLVDLNADSMAFLNATGKLNSKRLYLHFTQEDALPAYPQGVSDDTHFSEAGARAMARMVVRRLHEIRTPLRSATLPDALALQPGFIAGGPSCTAAQNVPG